MVALAAAVLLSTALASSAPAPMTVPYPGSGHDFNMQIEVNRVSLGLPGIIEIYPGDDLGLLVESPEGTFEGAPYAIGAKSFVTGGVPFPGLEEFHHVPLGSAEIVSDPNDSSFGTPVVTMSGTLVTLEDVPPELAGTNWMFQAFSLDPDDDSVVATSDGCEVHILE